jgi:hypothetical protein
MEDNIKANLTEMGLADVAWTDLAQDRNQRQVPTFGFVLGIS